MSGDDPMPDEDLFDDGELDDGELIDDDETGDDETGDEHELREPRRHPAIFASNWRTVLAVDGAVGVAIFIVGATLAITWNPIVGGFIGSVGFVYVALVVRRGQDWARQRREAGLQ